MTITATDERLRPVEILLVEDSPTDALLTREALSSAKMFNRLHHVTDGVAALEFLRKETNFANAATPDLILLDLNLPKKHGREVLREIKADDALKSIPVVVLTTSQHEADVLGAYDCHANCYVVKPVDFLKFVDIINSIESFWFAVATLPSDCRHPPQSRPSVG